MDEEIPFRTVILLLALCMVLPAIACMVLIFS